MSKDRHGKHSGPWEQIEKESFFRRLLGNPGRAPEGNAGKNPRGKEDKGLGWAGQPRKRKSAKGDNNPFTKPGKIPPKKGPWPKKPPKPKGGW